MTYDGANGGAGIYRQLLNYQFQESVDDVRGAFSFTVENETIPESGGKKITTFDRVKLRSIVKIYEGGDKAVFVGIIRRKSISVAMTAGGPRKSITFTGEALTGVIADFVLSLDIKISDVADASIETKKLTLALSSNQHLTIDEFLKITWEKYTELSIQNFKMNDCETTKTVKAFMSEPFFTHGKNDSPFYFYIANATYTQGNNNLIDMWRHILPNPVYEIYAYCDRNGGEKIMVREAPFDGDTWSELRTIKIVPISLLNYAFQQSDEEVYTVFNGYLEGSAMSHDFYTIVSQYDGSGNGIMQVDEDKLKRYGYRPLEVSFRGYDRRKNSDKNTESMQEIMRELNGRLKKWYARLPDMFSGTITLTTNFAEPERNPRVGEKVMFLGGEFYVQKAVHFWSYGETPTLTLSVARGMKYSDGGVDYIEKANTLENIGAARLELEQ
jgi:hypothetical protein